MRHLATDHAIGHAAVDVHRVAAEVLERAAEHEIVRRARERDTCLLYTSDAADERSSVDLGGRRILKKKKHKKKTQKKNKHTDAGPRRLERGSDQV